MLSLQVSRTNIHHEDQLPIELFTTIISFLDNATLAKIKRVNKTWRVVINKLLLQRKASPRNYMTFFDQAKEETTSIIALNLLFNPKNSYPDYLLRLLCFGLSCLIGLAYFYMANKYIDKIADKKMGQLLMSTAISIIALGATYNYAVKKAPLPIKVILFWTEIFCAITITKVSILIHNRKLEPVYRITIPLHGT